MAAANSMTMWTTGTLVEQIHALDLKIADRRYRVRSDIAALRGALRAKLSSPLMMIGAFGTGFLLGRTRAGQRSRSTGRGQPHHDAGLFERIFVAMAVMRSWSPLLRDVAAWFESPAKLSLDDGGGTVQAVSDSLPPAGRASSEGPRQ